VVLGLNKVDKEVLPPGEARSIGLQFIRGKYYQGQIAVDEPRLVTDGAFPVYLLTGVIKMPSPSIISKIFAPPAEYTFDMQIHALEGSILNYEVK
jgi:hypothetical protein